jgi:adenylate cyclase
MGVFRWILGSGFRVTMLIAVLVFVYHAANELRVLFGRPPNFHQRLELTALDVKFAARGPRPPEKWKVAIAAADEKAVQEYGPLPWKRSVHGKLVGSLTELGASAIAFDMTFDQASVDPVAEATASIKTRLADSGVFAAPEKLESAAVKTEKVAAELSKLRPKKLHDAVRDYVPSLREAANTLRTTKVNVENARAALNDERAVKDMDADSSFIAANQSSGRVVLGVIALSKLEAESLGADGTALKRSLAAVATSTISELLSKGDDGLDHVHSDAAKAFEEGLYRRFFGVMSPFDRMAHSTPHFGTINALPDDDGVYRRVSLVAALKGDGVLLPTLALKAVEVAVEQPIQVIGHPDDPAPQAITVGEYRIETELQASTTLDWYGKFSPEFMPIFSISDLNAGRVRKEDVAGRIFFVAATAAGTHDQRVTPLERAVPGVYIHATLAQNILDGRHLTRPRHVLVIELFLFLLIGVIAGLVMARLNVIGQLLTALLMAIGWVLLDQFVLFQSGLVVYTVLPIFQIFLTLLAVALWRFLVEQKERQKTRQAFGRYLAPAVMEQVLARPEEYLKLGGRRYEATVLFSDIRGFTTISEALSPEELGILLNRYMTPMTNLVFEYGGTLDKYIGDAVMAFWGAPLEQSDHAMRACRAALKMMTVVDDLNRDFESAGLPRIAIGIGLSSGPMTIGNMGSDDHFAYTALGDRVNLGSRLEGQTKDYGVDIIISDATHELVKSEMMCRELGALRVKGKYEPVRIFQLIGEYSENQMRQSFVSEFHQGLAAYRAQTWDTAIEHFTRARALSGINGDKTSDQYIMWCSEYKEAPPPEGWDGVRVATSK